MEKEKFLSKRLGIIIGSILFALCFLGVTYAAYLTGQTYNDVNMASQVTPDVSYTEDKTMMLQGILPTPRDIAIKAAALNGCYDKSEKPIPVCSLYEFTVTNTSLDELDQKVKFYLNIEENTYANYYYMVFDGEKENISEDIAPIIDSKHLPNNDLGKKYLDSLTIELTPNQSKTYTILFYVNETGENQLYIDTNKVFNASVKVEASTSGKYNFEPNKPDVSGGLVPIKYNGTNWVVTTEDDPDWYNYEEKKWANAAILKNKEDNVVGNELVLPDDTITESQSNVYAMFVWIPRFSYTIGCTSSSSCLGYKVEEASALSIETPGAIDIKFVSVVDDIEIPDMDNGIYPNYTYTNEANRTPTNYYTHPAFWWDKNGDGVRPEDNSEELSGIWVGKFETSVDSTSTCYSNLNSNNTSATTNCAASVSNVTPRILPNVLALTYQTVYNQFNTANKFSASGNIYGIDNTKTDSHMMKNSEWSAVAYLSQSIYGKYGNKDYSGINKEIYKNDSGRYVSISYWGGYTGRSHGLAPATDSYSYAGSYKYDVEGTGTGASTTGNIYGVYDMNGGAVEYVMGNYNNYVSESGISSSWFTTTSNIKYYDKFTTKTPFTTKNKQTMGQSLYEVAGWYGDNKDTFDSSYVWLARGGYYSLGSKAGAFHGLTNNGIKVYNYGFRSAFVMTIA